MNDVNAGVWCPYCNSVSDASCLYCPACGGHLGGNQVSGTHRRIQQEMPAEPYSQSAVTPYTAGHSYPPVSPQPYQAQAPSPYAYPAQPVPLQPYTPQQPIAPYNAYPAGMAYAQPPAPAYLPPLQQMAPLAPQVTVVAIPAPAQMPAMQPVAPSVLVINNDRRDHDSLVLLGGAFGLICSSLLITLLGIAILVAIIAAHM